jgi:glyceraldehyde-3-phosphate dehydrogenase/erythrose-4-phosphate dehydrogenase
VPFVPQSHHVVDDQVEVRLDGMSLSVPVCCVSMVTLHLR